MKLTAFLLIVACLHVSAKSFSQEKISLHEKEASLQKVFEDIQKQTHYIIWCDNVLIIKAGKIDLDISGASIDSVLDMVLSHKGLIYSIVNTIIVVKEKGQPEKKEALDIPMSAVIDIHGRVVDENAKPLAGVTVTVKGSKRSTSTDENGEFNLKSADNNATLVLTSVNMEAFELKVKGKADLLVTLKTKTSQLDEVQIIAYGTTTQRLNTGDVSTVTSKEISEQPVSNVLAAIEGRVPGLLITQSSGMPGSGFTVQIRGQNSISNGNDPFYVIDGVPYTSELISGLNPAGGSPLNFINPSDIESVSVLKDADATAIYGSRAANGAILITTKKGKAGKMKFDLTAYQGAGIAPLKVQWLNTPQYLQMRHEALNNDGVTPNLSNGDNDLLLWDTTRYTNWQKRFIGSSTNYSDIQAGISGGSTNTQYQLGGAFHRESSPFPFTGFDQNASVHLNVSTTSSDERFRATITANYLVNNSTLPSGDFTQFLNTPPDAPPVYNSDGTLNWANGSWPDGNPMSQTLQKYIAQSNNLVANTVLSYRLCNGLDIKSNFGYTDLQTSELSTSPIIAQNPSYNPTGSATLGYNNIHSWIVEPQITYQLNFGNNKISALIGSTFNQNTSTGNQLNGSGYTSDLLLEDLQAAPTLHATVTDNVYKYNALFGRLNYNYDKKYLLNINWRRDGSSRFGPGNEFHNFASIGGAWVFTEENVLKKLSILSFGKLRGSYGTTGNDQIGDYKYYDLFQTTYYPYQGTIGLTPTGLYNPNLQWELTKKFEGALELGFLKDRIIVQASHYINRSSNQLLSQSLPFITGFGAIPVNLPATVQNSGWEFTATTTNIKKRSFTWKTSFNLSLNRNKIVSFPGLSTSSSYQNVFYLGKPIGEAKLYHCLGVDQASGLYIFSDSTGKATLSPSYSSDRTAFVDALPKFYGGFQNTFIYKGWQLDVFFEFRKQLGTNFLLQPIFPPGFEGKNVPTYMLDNWQSPGDHKPIEKFTQSFASAAFAAYGTAQASDYDFVDASFIRLKNLSLSYQLSANWTQKLHLKDVRLFFHGQNLLTITRYKGMDPENQSLSSLPPMRVLTGGFQLSL